MIALTSLFHINSNKTIIIQSDHQHTLHTKFSEKLVSWQMQMLAEIYDIWPTLQHVHNMSMTFPTKRCRGGLQRGVVVAWHQKMRCCRGGGCCKAGWSNEAGQCNKAGQCDKVERDNEAGGMVWCNGTRSDGATRQGRAGQRGRVMWWGGVGRCNKAG